MIEALESIAEKIELGRTMLIGVAGALEQLVNIDSDQGREVTYQGALKASARPRRAAFGLMD